MKKALLFILALSLMPLSVYAADSTAFVPLGNHQAESISGVSLGDQTKVRLIITDDDGHIMSVPFVDDTFLTLSLKLVDIPDAGATDRTQLPSLTADYGLECVLQSPITNAGGIYVGDVAVTNSSGALEGILLMPGWSWAVDSLSNLNVLYVATDNAGDDVKVLCK